jgi:hypothetical protein
MPVESIADVEFGFKIGRRDSSVELHDLITPSPQKDTSSAQRFLRDITKGIMPPSVILSL